MAENTVKIRLEAQGIQTLGQLEQAIKKAKLELKGIAVGSSEFVVAQKKLVGLKEAASELAQQTYTANGRMMQSYFRLGEELRRNRFAMVELAGAAGFDRAGLGAVLRALAGGGGILAVVGGLTAMINLVRDTTKEIAKLDEQIAELTGKRLPWLRTHLEELQKEDVAWYAKLAGGHSGLGLFFSLLASKDAKQNQADILDTQKKISEEAKKQTDSLQSQVDLWRSALEEETKTRLIREKKITDEKQAQIDAVNRLLAAEIRSVDQLSAFERKRLGVKTIDRFGNAFGRKGQEYDPVTGLWVDEGTRKKEVWADDAKKGFNILEQSSLALGDTLSSSLGNAFTQVFGLANSLLEQFAERLFQILGENLILGILSLVTKLPLGGFNLGSTAPAPEGPTGTNGMIELRVRGNGDLVAAVDIGRRNLARRS